MKCNSNISNESWLVKTGQTWKLKTSIVIGIFDLVLFLLVIWSISSPSNMFLSYTGFTQLNVDTVFLLFGLMLFYFLFWSIKCPSCKKRIGYHIIKTTDINNWLKVLISFDNCPNCKYPRESGT